jgi:hypothetical protein
VVLVRVVFVVVMAVVIVMIVVMVIMVVVFVPELVDRAAMLELALAAVVAAIVELKAAIAAAVSAATATAAATELEATGLGMLTGQNPSTNYNAEYQNVAGRFHRTAPRIEGFLGSHQQSRQALARRTPSHTAKQPAVTRLEQFLEIGLRASKKRIKQPRTQ